MTIHMAKEMEALKRRILALSAVVEERFVEALRALERRDVSLARKVLGGDDDIDQLEVELEEECLKVLALHQPVAVDLRYIVAVLKMNSELERIGDLAANVAEVAEYLTASGDANLPEHLYVMAEKSKQMLHLSLDALVNLDIDAARYVCKADEVIDQLHRESFSVVEAAIQADPAATPRQLRFLSVSRYLERIADHATNIAEDIVYLIQGDIIRHQDDDTLA
jgi:phosphate transport system protein